MALKKVFETVNQCILNLKKNDKFHGNISGLAKERRNKTDEIKKERDTCNTFHLDKQGENFPDISSSSLQIDSCHSMVYSRHCK